MKISQPLACPNLRTKLTSDDVQLLMLLTKLRQAAEGDLLAFLMLRWTGMRGSDVVGLRWEEIDWETHEINRLTSNAASVFYCQCTKNYFSHWKSNRNAANRIRRTAFR
jgi:integrase